MFREIPKNQIAKAKKLLSTGHSLRSVEFLTGLSFTKVRTIFREMSGLEEEKKEPGNRFFKVDGKCWLTGIKLELNRVRK